MRVGHSLISMGVLLAAMSIATLAFGLGGKRSPSPPPTETLLTVAWTLACLPYPAGQDLPSSRLSAYSCQ